MRARWTKNILLVFLYILVVALLENLLILQYWSLTYDERSSPATDDGLLTNVTSFGNDSDVTNAGGGGMNLSARVLSYVASNTSDLSEMHLVQMHLLACYQRTKDVLRCLAEEYASHRKPETRLERNTPANRKVAPVVVIANDPKLEAQYYRRRETKVNPYKYDYHISPRDVCNNETFLVVLVHSFHPYKDRREAIRATWGRVALGGKWPGKDIVKPIRLVFMLATHREAGYNKALQEEANTHKDIVQGDFIDAYPNMTLKSLLGLKWVMERCPSAKYLLKSDDDMFINMPFLLDVLVTRRPVRGIMGPLNQGSRVYHSGKWKIRTEDFPFKYYPPYESGAAYVISTDIVRELYETAEYVPPIHVDDAYITGILGKIIGVQHYVQKGFAYWSSKPPQMCQFITGEMLTGTRMTPPRLLQTWNTITQGATANIKCNTTQPTEHVKNKPIKRRV